MARTVTVESARGLKQSIHAGEHALTADEPAGAGGEGAGPDPYELLLSALGACTSMTLVLYARHKGWPLARVSVRLAHDKIHAEDCAECETKTGIVDRIEREITLEGDLSEDQRARLLQIANRCPVHRTLTSQIDIVSRLV